MQDSPTGPRPVVLQVVPALGTGGVERGTVEMAEAIAGADGVALVASAGGRLVPAVEHAGGRHILLPLASKNPFTIWRNAGRLARLIAAERVDIVHARSRAPAWSAWLAARRTGVHFLTTYHAPYGEDLPFKRAYNSVMAKGELVIAISRFIGRLVQERHGVPPGRVRVIPRGVDPVRFDPAQVAPDRLAKLSRAWRLPDGAPVIMLPGRLTRWKGQGVLVEALALMRARDPVCVLVGADQGRRRYAAGLLRRAEELGVADRLRLAGNCEDMPAALRLSDVVVSASIEPEGFGRVVIEAQAMGRPVIATAHGGAAETIEPGVTGWHVPPDDPAALAAALDAVLAMSVEARAELGARARASVLAQYTTRAMQEATLDVYTELLG
jgi:glycosyltransferase involved in cell wall biosynthesis